MAIETFSHVRHWVFDLDDTLYPAHVRLLDHVRVRMTGYLIRELALSEAEADRLRKQYWREHGTTLAGLMHHHDIEPWPFLREVHDVPMDALTPDPELARLIQDLPGQRIVYTNGDAEYAARVLAARGLGGVFDGVFGVEHADWRPKPEQPAFETVFAKASVVPESGAMFEDDPRNLAVPHRLGMRTIHVAPKPADAPHIDHKTSDLNQFLRAIQCV